MFSHGGEGSARWFFIPEHQNLPGGFDFYEGMKETIKSGKAEIVTTEEYGMKPGPVSLSDDSKYHLDNWVDCMRNRDVSPNGNIHNGVQFLLFLKCLSLQVVLLLIFLILQEGDGSSLRRKIFLLWMRSSQ